MKTYSKIIVLKNVIYFCYNFRKIIKRDIVKYQHKCCEDYYYLLSIIFVDWIALFEKLKKSYHRFQISNNHVKLFIYLDPRRAEQNDSPTMKIWRQPHTVNV